MINHKTAKALNLTIPQSVLCAGGQGDPMMAENKWQGRVN